MNVCRGSRGDKERPLDCPGLKTVSALTYSASVFSPVKKDCHSLGFVESKFR